MLDFFPHKLTLCKCLHVVKLHACTFLPKKWSVNLFWTTAAWSQHPAMHCFWRYLYLFAMHCMTCCMVRCVVRVPLHVLEHHAVQCMCKTPGPCLCYPVFVCVSGLCLWLCPPVCPSVRNLKYRSTRQDMAIMISLWPGIFSCLCLLHTALIFSNPL